MPISLSSGFNPSVALQSSYSTPAEDAAVAAQMEQERLNDMGVIGRGLTRGMYNVGAGLQNMVGQVIEPMSTQYSQPIFDAASVNRQHAASITSPNDVTSFDQVDSLGSAGRFIGGAVAENIPNALATIPLALAARFGLRGAALSPFAKNLAATSVGAFPLQMGEMVGSMRDDPTIMANTTAGQRLGTAAGYGALTAPMEALDEALLMGRATGAGQAVKNVFKDGIGASAKDAFKHVAKAVPEAALTEGAPEVLQTATQQGMLNHLNPTRDTSGDAHELKDSFFKGWAAGGATSAVGRGADVAWAQGRGATEALSNLLKPKVLPETLRNSDDNSIVDWDKQDDAQRNSWAKDIADRVMNSDATQSMKDAAKSFYEKASQGASDAWTSMSDALGEHEYVQKSKAGLDHFMRSVKKANSAVGGKNNSEASPEDQALYDNFSSHLDSRGSAARDTEQKSNLFNTVKDSLLDDSWHELPWHALEDQFGTIGKATEAVVKLRENLVRTGKLEHDDEFKSLLDASANEGQAGERAMMDVVHRYGKEYINTDRGDKRIDSQLREFVRGARSMMTDAAAMKKHGAAFTSEMTKQFGSNSEKVLQALAPKQVADSQVDTSEGQGAENTVEAKTSFVGQATKSARQNISSGNTENTIASHGGFFKLGSKADGDKSISKRFKDTAADLRKSGNYVRALNPLQYVEASGISAGKVAAHLGTTVEGLKDHPARILMVEPRNMEKDKLSLDGDDLTGLADKTSKTLSRMPESVRIEDPAKVAAIKKALGMKGAAQRKAMKALGLEHGVGIRETAQGAFLTNNRTHGGNGVFHVEMNDGAVHNISAQQLIETMRERGRGEFSSRSAYSMFNAGVAALMNIDGVKNVTTTDIWGRKDDKPFHDTSKSKKHFKLMNGMTLGQAHQASLRGEPVTEVDKAEAALQKVKDRIADIEDLAYGAEGEKAAAYEAEKARLEEELAELEAAVDEAVALEEAKQTEMEGDADRPGTVGASDESATDQNVTPTEAAREKARDFNEDGSPVQPYGRDADRTTDREAKKFNGMVLRLHSGVSSKDLTGGARIVLGVIKQARSLLTGDALTGKFDMALDLIGRAAAANHDSNAKARKALEGMAANAVLEAVADEMAAIHEEANSLPVDQRDTLRAQYAKLSAIVKNAELVALRADYLANREKADEQIGQYMPFRPSRPKRDSNDTKAEMQGDRWSHHDVFLASLEGKTDEEIKADGVARNKRIEKFSKFSGEKIAELLGLMEMEQRVARNELRDRKSGLKIQKAKNVEQVVGASSIPTEAARKAKAEIEELQKFLKETKAAQRELEGAVSKKDKKALADLKAHEQELRDKIRALIPQSNETTDGAVVSRNSKTEAATKLPTVIVNKTDAVAIEAAEQGRADAELKAQTAENVAKNDDAVNDFYDQQMAEREEVAAEHEAKFEKAINEAIEKSDSEKLVENLGKTADALRAAFKTLKDSYIAGEFNKSDLVANLRAAAAAFKAAVGDAARIVQQVVQQFIKDYQSGKLQSDVKAGLNALSKAAKKIAANVSEQGRGYFDSVFGSEEKDTRSKLIERLASKFKGQFETGFEQKSYDKDIAGLGSYKTYMAYMPEAKQYQFMIVPDVIADKFIADYAALNKIDADTVRKNFEAEAARDPIFLAHLAVFGGSYQTKSNYIGINSAIPDSISEAFLAEKGMLGKETGSSGTEWNVLKGMQASVLHSSLGEFYARLQAITGQEHVKGNWNRDTGANKRRHEAGQLNAEGSFADGKGVTPDQMNEVKDYITKVLGPKIKVQLSKALGGNSAAWNRVNGETIIRIAANATNPTSKAHHEAMHEFFQRLMENNPETADILRKAAGSPAVVRQIEQFFNNDANYAKIKQQITTDEHERVAYMFQLWAAGKLNVGPNTKSVFQKVVDFFRKAFGLLSNDQKAVALMEHFHNGEMSTQNDVARILANDPVATQKFADKAAKWMEPIARMAKSLLYTAQNTLIESGNKSFEKIGRMFSTETGRQNDEMSFFDAKTMKTNQMNDRLWAILSEKGADGKKLFNDKDVAAALEGLQQGKTSKDTNIAHMQDRIRKMLDQIHDYMNTAGVDVKKRKNYFPRSWDSAAIAENRGKFIAMLQADHFDVTGKKLDDTVAGSIADNIIQNRGAEPLNEDELANGYSPFMAATNKRVLDFIKNPEFSQFQEKNLETILTTYVAQAVHKAEYTKRFGANGTKLREMILDGIGEEVGAEWDTARDAAKDRLKTLRDSMKAAGKTPAEIAVDLASKGYRYGEIQIQHVEHELQSADAKAAFTKFEPEMRRQIRAVMAMEGTLGSDINPSLRKWQSGLIVYENMRLLSMSLFSQVIDPLGVMVRGGSVGDAWNTFKRGLAGTWAGWKGTPMDDRMTRLAMKLGIVDAGGYLNSQGNAYASIYMGKTAQKWNDRLFRMNGVEGFSQGTRVGAMEAAISFIEAHSKLPSEHSERWLAELNLKASDIQLDSDGHMNMDDPKIQQAVFRWVESAILRPNASMRPSWASDPHFALIFHMKQFTYAMQKVLLERVGNEAEKGNYDPAITMLLTYVPAMIAADFLRGLAANGGEEPPWKRKWNAGDYLWSGVQRAGLLGIPQFGIDAIEWGPTELAGPFAGQVAHTAETFEKAIKRDHALDMKAATSGLKIDAQKADDFNGILHGAKKTLRDASPINSITKHYVFDELLAK